MAKRTPAKVQWACASAMVLLLLAMAPSSSIAQNVEIRLKPAGSAPPSAIAFGRGADMPEMPYDAADKAFAKTVKIAHALPETYEIALVYGENTRQIPLELHRSSRPINLRVKFDGPPFCREALVKEAETPAQEGNIPQALERYLLAVHLSEIRGEDAKCRGSQPARLHRARIERGIQLAIFRGSPFLPPENNEGDWARIIGPHRTRTYMKQVEQASAIALGEDRTAAMREGDFAAAALVNAAIISQAAQNEASRTALAAIGFSEARLLQDQKFLENRAKALGQDIAEGSDERRQIHPPSE